MSEDNIKKMLEEIVYNTLYISSDLSSEDKEKLQSIKDYFKKSKNTINDLRTIISTRTSENYFVYDNYLAEILPEIKYETKLEILNEQLKYNDIFKDNKLYLAIWKSLSLNEKIDYLIEKRKFTNLDIIFINEAIKDNSDFMDNSFLNQILDNEEIRKKITPFSIEITYSYGLQSKIKLNDFEVCSILSKKSYTELILKKCKTFNDFFSLYKSNEKIANLILNNSLIFDNEDNQDIYEFILKNPNFIGKFNIKYLDLFSIVEITNMSKIKTLDSDAYSTIIQKLYLYNNNDAEKYFNEESLKRCTKHSITIYPFEDLNKELVNKIFNNYVLFNRFIDTIMIEAINKNFEEEDILNILRNDSFVQDMSPYAIELLLNKLSFKSTFNMLQRKEILDKINYLNVKIQDKDTIFLKGFLDSPTLINKSNHTMIYDMLNLLNKNDMFYYIESPYIYNNLSNTDILNLCYDKEISLNEVIESKALKVKLDLSDIINYIDRCFEKNIDLQIFKNNELSSKLFNIDIDKIKEIDFDEVNYLFETIRMKSLLSKQDITPTVLSYKSVLSSYLFLGLNETLELVSNGNMNLTLEDVKKLQKEIIEEKILIFKENNSSVFQNMAKKILSHLQKFKDTLEYSEFTKEIKKDTYLDNIVYLMLDNNYETYNKIIEKLFGYIKYHNYNEFASKKEIYDYANNFIETYIANQAQKYNNDFEQIIRKNFKPKENIIYNRRKTIGKSFVNNLEFKLFVRALTDSNKEFYKPFFNEEYNLNDIKDDYIKFLANDDVDFDSILSHVLYPIANDRFDKDNCLNKLGIQKPLNTDDYTKHLEDTKFINKLNRKVKEYIKTYNYEETLQIMNFICYGTDINVDLTTKHKKEIKKLLLTIPNLKGEIYIDKSTLKFIYKDSIDVYNTDEIIEYNNYVKILDNIIKRTNTFINNHMNDEQVKNYYLRDYFKAIDNDNCLYPISSRYYELRKRVFSLKDMEKIFNGFDLTNIKSISPSLEDFLFNKKNIMLIADGYYNDFIDNFGLIISKWDKIIEHTNEFKLDIDNLSLLRIKNILTLIHFKDNAVGKEINAELLKQIYNDDYYEVTDINKRINSLLNLYKSSFKRVSSTIPYIKCILDNYTIEIGDSYNQEEILGMKDSPYKIGTKGNDFLYYTILNKNGLQILIHKDEKLIAKILGVRNGNTIFLNGVEGLEDNMYYDLLTNFAREIIKTTKEDTEPIEFITIVNNELFTNDNGLTIDKTLCPFINNPINTTYFDYEEFLNNDHLLHPEENIYTNYADGVITLLASSNIIDKNNFKTYDAEAKYRRNRNKVIKISNNVNEKYLNKIDTILELCKLEQDTFNISNISLNKMDTIYIGDDFVLFITNHKEILKYVLPYDDRSCNEINMILDGLNKKS